MVDIEGVIEVVTVGVVVVGEAVVVGAVGVLSPQEVISSIAINIATTGNDSNGLPISRPITITLQLLRYRPRV